MQWTDDGILLSVRRLGEASIIADVMTRSHGRHAGVVRGGRSRRLAPVLQPGNAVSVTWQARLAEQLGTYVVEGTELRAAAMMGSGAFLNGITCLACLVSLLPECDPHEAVYEALRIILQHLHRPELAGPLLVRFELQMLAELGFGLELSECAATGGTQELIYISPKSGRAVSRAAGEPYADRLLPLPGFLRGSDAAGLTAEQLLAGFAVTGYFLERRIMEPRGLLLPEARRAFRDLAVRQLGHFTEP
jgi:DNA repair protein RecO (recombination protein O)